MNYTYTNTTASQEDYRTRRSRDNKDEKIVGQFLDTYFYPTFTTTVTRNTDKETQIQGLDVTVTNPQGYSYTIDEKAATRWAGRNLQTFAHEISSVNVSGNTYDGWLLDFHSASDYLVEVWIDGVSTTDGRIYKYDDITDATVVLIKKSDLYHYLKSKNISSSKLKEIGEYLRNYGQYSYMYNGFKITCQQNCQERAANILLSRDTLINSISIYAVQIKDFKAITLSKQANI